MTDKNPVKYAENTLGVHMPWEQASAVLKKIEQHRLQLVHLRSIMRHTKGVIEDRKLSILNEAPSRSDWPSSHTAQQSALKVLYQTDSGIIELNDEVERIQNKIEESEAEIKHGELELQVLIARMNELGGLLQFYAACKNTAIQVKHIPNVEMETRV